MLLEAVIFKPNSCITKVRINRPTSFISIKRTVTYDNSSIEDEDDRVRDVDISDIDEATLSSSKLRNVLYPDSNDPVVNKLKLCRTVQEVLNLVDENEHNFNHEHCSQALVVLWDLQKLYEIVNSVTEPVSKKTHFQNIDLLNSYKEELNKHETFNSLLHLTFLTYKAMSPDALSCSFLFLRRMGVSFTHPLLQGLILHIEHLLITIDPVHFPLTALSRFSVGMFYDKDLRSTLILIKILPHVIKNIGRIDNIEDFRTITISMRTIVYVIEKNLIEDYRAITEKLIAKGLFTSEHISVIFKSLLLLDQPFWAQENISTVRKLLMLLCGLTKQMTNTQISYLQKVISHHLEPYSLMRELEANTGQILVDYKIGDFHSNDSFLVAAATGKQQRGMLIARDIVNNSTCIRSLFEIFQFISISDMETCNKYWMKLFKLVQSSEYDDGFLFSMCSRYMNFSSNMAWYRNIPFERKVVEYLMKEMVEGIGGYIPNKFAQIASFLLVYSNPTYISMPKHIVSKILENMDQFSLFDCEHISRGLSIAMDIRRRRKLTQEFLQQFVSLDAALNLRTLHFVSNEDKLSVMKLNKIMRAYIHRKGTIDSGLFHQLVERFEKIEESELTSRGLREIVYNLISTHTLIPDLLDKMVSYCIKQNEHIIGDTASKLLYGCYYLGHTPSQSEEFFDVASQLITRDKEELSGLVFLQAALAFCYFNHLPASLVQFIFTVDFLEHLDKEIKHCYAKATYPVRVRRTLMELNRAVCLDQPEAGVPWFHAKYCEEQHALGLQQRYYNSPFLTDVQHKLVLASGSKDFIQTNVSSPYGYNIDIQVCLDKDQKPVDIRKTDTDILSKVAILLQVSDNFTTRTHQLKGFHQMKQRHLEMLGYRVVSIDESLWNAMYMAEPKAKLNYLKNLILT